MERCDFSSVMTIIRRYISEDYNMSQVDLLYELFAAFVNHEESRDLYFDSGQVSRWMKGSVKLSPRISGFYLEPEHRQALARDLASNILPLMYDSPMAVHEIHDLLIQDSTISSQTRELLARLWPCKDREEEAAFVAGVLYFGMEREFVRRDIPQPALTAGGGASPVVRDLILDGDVPAPCRHFCGREEELSWLHQLIEKEGKVLLHGIPGIGKSELAKAYAKEHRKEYTNTLWLSYTGSLARDIAGLDFADDLPGENMEERFRRHNRLLRSLKEDTLLIVDNFNTTPGQEPALDVVMKYRCRVLFTTRSRLDCCPSLELTEIQNLEVLLTLARHFYSQAGGCETILAEIIETVHRHTLAVELAARLLERGILEPRVLLDKLRAERAALDATDKIGITKDGHSTKATYYEHIHTLFSLCCLNDGEETVMRALVFTPSRGIPLSILANWLRLPDGNTVNDLVERGFVQTVPGRKVALHPMIREVAVVETIPSVSNCVQLLSGLQEVCLRHGKEVPYYKALFETIQSVLENLKVDDSATYLRFLEDVFPYLEKYENRSAMERVVEELSRLLQHQTLGSQRDWALLLDYRAACEGQPERALKLEQEALECLGEITGECALLAANLHGNLGALYRRVGKLELARHHMETGMKLLEEYRLTLYHDSITQIANYAALMADLGQPQVGLTALGKLARELAGETMDRALVQESMARICLGMGDVEGAVRHDRKAMEIYRTLFPGDLEAVEGRREKILARYAQAGLNSAPYLTLLEP